MASTIKIKRGLADTLPAGVIDGELRYSKDTGELNISSNNRMFTGDSGNELLVKAPLKGYNVSCSTVGEFEEVISKIKNRELFSDIQVICSTLPSTWSLWNTSGSGKFHLINTVTPADSTATFIQCNHIQISGDNAIKLGPLIKDSHVEFKGDLTGFGQGLNLIASTLEVEGIFDLDGDISLYKNSTLRLFHTVNVTNGAVINADASSTLIIEEGVSMHGAKTLVSDTFAGRVIDKRSAMSGAYNTSTEAGAPIIYENADFEYFKTSQVSPQDYYHVELAATITLGLPQGAGFTEDLYIRRNGDRIYIWGPDGGAQNVWSASLLNPNTISETDWQLERSAVFGKTFVTESFVEFEQEIARITNKKLLTPEYIEIGENANFTGKTFSLVGIDGTCFIFSFANTGDPSDTGSISVIQNCSDLHLQATLNNYILWNLDTIRNSVVELSRFILSGDLYVDSYSKIVIDMLNRGQNVYTVHLLYSEAIIYGMDSPVDDLVSLTVEVGTGSTLFIRGGYLLPESTAFKEAGGVIVDERKYAPSTTYVKDTVETLDQTKFTSIFQLVNFLKDSEVLTRARTVRKFFVQDFTLLTDAPISGNLPDFYPIMTGSGYLTISTTGRHQATDSRYRVEVIGDTSYESVRYIADNFNENENKWYWRMESKAQSINSVPLIERDTKLRLEFDTYQDFVNYDMDYGPIRPGTEVVILDEYADVYPDIYALTETPTVRKWIDGRSIYRRVFKGTIPSLVSGYNSIALDTVADVDELISVFGNINYAYSGNSYSGSATGNIQSRLTELAVARVSIDRLTGFIDYGIVLSSSNSTTLSEFNTRLSGAEYNICVEYVKKL